MAQSTEHCFYALTEQTTSTISLNKKNSKHFGNISPKFMDLPCLSFSSQNHSTSCHQLSSLGRIPLWKSYFCPMPLINSSLNPFAMLGIFNLSFYVYHFQHIPLLNVPGLSLFITTLSLSHFLLYPKSNQLWGRFIFFFTWSLIYFWLQSSQFKPSTSSFSHYSKSLLMLELL